MTRKILLLSLVSAILLGVSPVPADGDFYVVVVPGGVGTKITSLPYTITAPGFYYLTGNLTCPSGTGIVINADDVTLDLMGFCLSGTSSYYAIVMNGRKNVEVRNGTLRGWYTGIAELSTAGFTHRVINVRVDGGEFGIYLTGNAHLIKGCTAANNNTQGITIDTGTVSGNQVINCNSYGIRFYGLGNVRSNVVKDCHCGIYIKEGSVIGNTVTCKSGQTGISLFPSAPIMVDQNTVSGAGSHYVGGGPDTVWGTNAGR